MLSCCQVSRFQAAYLITTNIQGACSSGNFGVLATFRIGIAVTCAISIWRCPVTANCINIKLALTSSTEQKIDKAFTRRSIATVATDATAGAVGARRAQVTSVVSFGKIPSGQVWGGRARLEVCIGWLPNLGRTVELPVCGESGTRLRLCHLAESGIFNGLVCTTTVASVGNRYTNVSKK